MLIKGLTRDDYDGRQKLFRALGNEDEHGGVPFPLPNMKPVKDFEFWSWKSSGGIWAEIWAGHAKPWWPRIDGDPFTLWVYWVNAGSWINGGFAVAVLHRGTVAAETRYFSWAACEHQFIETTVGNCHHRCTCSKCGASYDYHSD